MNKNSNSKKFTLKIVPFKNPSGKFVHRVTGRVLGIKVEKNFPTHEQAEAFMDECLERATQGKSAPTRRAARTSFKTDAELRVAELAAQRLAEKCPGVSILTVVDDYLARTVVVIDDISAKEAIENFGEALNGRGAQEVTKKQATTVLSAFVERFKVGKMVSDMPKNAEGWVYDKTVGLRTRRDRFDLLVNFSKFLQGRQYLACSLVTGLKRPTVSDEGDVTILTVQQCQRLLDAAALEPCSRHRVRGMMLAYIACCLLSGLRPEEVKRLTWQQASFENRVITGFRAKVSSRSRTVKMSDQLYEILLACKNAGLPLGYFSRKAFEQIQCAAGIRLVLAASETDSGEAEIQSDWDNDILRHCYASYSYAAMPGEKGNLIKNMGNSEAVIDQSYLNQTVLAPDGVKFLAIRPADVSQLGTKAPREQRPRARQLEQQTDRSSPPSAGHIDEASQAA
jgi:integrase